MRLCAARMDHCALTLGGTQTAILAVRLAKKKLTPIFSSFTSFFAHWGICNHFKASKPMYNHVKIWFWEYYRRKSRMYTQK